MVLLPAVKEAVTALVTSQPLVAVFVGGTSGIGQNTIRELARVQGEDGPGLRAYIVGRSETAAEETIAVCRQACPRGTFTFVKAEDLALIKDVDKVCAKLIHLETEAAHGEKDSSPRIDMLYISTYRFQLGPRDETEEGIDRSMSLIYYARMRVIVDLLPLLLRSRLPAHVVSVSGPGMETDFHAGDLSLRQPENSGFIHMRSHGLHMTTLFAEALVQQHPGRLSICHANPGVVLTTLFQGSHVPWWFRLLFNFFRPLLWFRAFSSSENGERMLFLSTPRFSAVGEGEDTRRPHAVAMGSDGVVGGGVYAVLPDGETVPSEKMDQWYASLRADGMVRKVYDHTMKAFEEAEAGRRFAG